MKQGDATSDILIFDSNLGELENVVNSMANISITTSPSSKKKESH